MTEYLTYRTKDAIKVLIEHYRMILWYLDNFSAEEIQKKIDYLTKELEEVPD